MTTKDPLTKAERKLYNQLHYKLLDKDKHKERMRKYMSDRRKKGKTKHTIHELRSQATIQKPSSGRKTKKTNPA